MAACWATCAPLDQTAGSARDTDRDRRDLEAYVRYTQALCDAAASAFHHGLSISEVAVAWKPAERFAAYAPMPERINANAQVIFSELTR